jgi:hypothetical protein
MHLLCQRRGPASDETAKREKIVAMCNLHRIAHLKAHSTGKDMVRIKKATACPGADFCLKSSSDDTSPRCRNLPIKCLQIATM